MLNFEVQLHKRLRIFTIELCAFIAKKLRELYGEHWRDKLSTQLQSSLFFADLNEDNTRNDQINFEQISHLIEDLWNDCFSTVFKNKAETMKNLSDINNIFVTVKFTRDSVTDNDVWRALNSMASLIKHINKDAALEIFDIINNEVIHSSSETSTPKTVEIPPTEEIFLMLIELTPVNFFQSANDTVKRTGFPLAGGNDKGGPFLFLSFLRRQESIFLFAELTA
ncbi:Swt1 family HEPN domain-containing protein [Candidatus Magnetomonas plexicatena]|uniref:Swt1 family HEPN domain-containing protein n=1 Tax=Candidatus Magnetomonas plexicatena TaxID=2552947 RepID=UPI001C766711|nr:hypothetical protein E2O03_014300 [Nitrospirales bacterium LBB_01]